MFKIKKLPMMAGKIRLINQTDTEVSPIPRVLVVNNPINLMLISPLNPTSIKAMEGMRARVRKITLIVSKIINKGKCTSNRLKIKEYCIINTTYRIKDINKSLIKSPR